jgi:hypothetical protein
MEDGCIDSIADVLKNAENRKESDGKVCWCCVRLKQELNSVVMEMESAN